MRSIRILFSGGGTLGHILPSVAVLEELRKREPGIIAHFICSPSKTETLLLSELGLPYSVLSAPKFPRSFSRKALLFPVAFMAALLQSLYIFWKVRPTIVFAKGGYVSVAPALLARALGIPVVLHTSDAAQNFSDRIVGRFAAMVCTGFPLANFPTHLRRRAVQTGNPVRHSVSEGSRERGLRYAGISGDRPIVLVMGGSQGAKRINEAIEECFTELLRIADVLHITGVGKEIRHTHPGYRAWTHIGKELPDLLAAADLVVTRAGAGALSELATLRKACIILPLQGVAHDHQRKNAEFFASRGAGDILLEGQEHELLSHIQSLLTAPTRLASYRENIGAVLPPDAASRIASIVLDAAR